LVEAPDATEPATKGVVESESEVDMLMAEVKTAKEAELNRHLAWMRTTFESDIETGRKVVKRIKEEGAYKESLAAEPETEPQPTKIKIEYGEPETPKLDKEGEPAPTLTDTEKLHEKLDAESDAIEVESEAKEAEARKAEEREREVDLARAQEDCGIDLGGMTDTERATKRERFDAEMSPVELKERLDAVKAKVQAETVYQVGIDLTPTVPEQPPLTDGMTDTERATKRDIC
jgi:hypothetical protein